RSERCAERRRSVRGAAHAGAVRSDEPLDTHPGRALLRTVAAGAVCTRLGARAAAAAAGRALCGRRWSYAPRPDGARAGAGGGRDGRGAERSSPGRLARLCKPRARAGAGSRRVLRSDPPAPRAAAARRGDTVRPRGVRLLAWVAPLALSGAIAVALLP